MEFICLDARALCLVPFLQMGEKAKAVEIKYQLGRASSESFARAARQLRSAFKHTDDVVLISLRV